MLKKQKWDEVEKSIPQLLLREKYKLKCLLQVKLDLIRIKGVFTFILHLLDLFETLLVRVKLNFNFYAHSSSRKVKINAKII